MTKGCLILEIDFVVAYSVFSHLSEEVCLNWINIILPKNWTEE